MAVELVENLLLILLSGLSVSVFFSQTGIDMFGPFSLLVLLIWKYALKWNNAASLPPFLLIAVALFIIDLFVGAYLSDDRNNGLSELRKYWNVFLCGLLYECPLGAKKRKWLMAVFFVAASASAFSGIWQFISESRRAHGFAHPIHFATILSFACGSAIVMLIIKNEVFSGIKGRLFLVLTVLLTFGGILSSWTRGVWMAFVIACFSVVFVYNWKKASAMAALMGAVLVISFAASEPLRERASSIVTAAISKKDTAGSVQTRLELWKGAILIFKKSPVLGTGIGDFKNDIKALIEDKQLEYLYVTSHAHNIYLHWLSTQGLVGLILLIALLISLMSWGFVEIRRDGRVGGYLMVFSTLIVILGGITENNIGISKIFAAYCLSMGLFGRAGSKDDAHEGTVETAGPEGLIN